MNLQSSDFELFNLPVKFEQNSDVIDARWKQLQREAHPDKFAAQGPSAQRVAMQWSVRINEAYTRLKEPLKRATYLCKLNEVSVNAESNTAMPAGFLAQQLEWRETLEEAHTAQALEEIAQNAADAREHQLSLLKQLLDLKKDFAEAARQIRSLMFIERFSSEVNARIDQLGQ